MAVPAAVNEPVRSYAPGSPERAELESRLDSMAQERIEIPVIIGGERIKTGLVEHVVMPHAHGHVLADWHRATPELVEKAIAAACQAQRDWANWPWEDRAAIFLKAAELLATTGAPSTRHDARPVEDGAPGRDRAACELIDFLPFKRAPSPIRSTASQRASPTAASGTASTTADRRLVYAITRSTSPPSRGNLATPRRR